MKPADFYQQQLEKHQAALKQLKTRSRVLSIFRLLVFMIAATSTYFFWGQAIIISSSLMLTFSLFLLLVSKYSDVKNEIAYTQRLIDLNNQEMTILSGDFSKRKTGNQYIFEEHDYNQDIDLFGQGSLFQLINRTEIPEGEATLAQWLNSNDTHNISSKQIAISELKEKAIWRQHYAATASLIDTEIPSATILNWIKKYTHFIPSIFRILPIIFSSISVLVLTAYSLGYLSGVSALLWLVLGIFITAPYVKRITQLYNSACHMKETFGQYAKLLDAIEQEQFETETLQHYQQLIETKGRKASETFRQISRYIDYLGNRNNMIFAPLANGFLLWDLFYAHKIENWLQNFNHSVDDWFKSIEYFDASNSLGNFAFNHPDYIYPTITKDSNLQIKATGLGHPLLKPDNMVKNDLLMKKEDFLIITGANMAGKSTFLRTVAVNIVLANCGLPVCADNFEFAPIKLISSMRTSDSLTNDESYFFSELKRLKFIVEKLNNSDYFIILDEILKGTNSKDKAEGSQKFVERLVGTKSTGLIATHDLSLCTLADKLPTVYNHYFDAEIVNDELYFDYRFKDGICQNMNASFLLKKMGIV